MYWQEVSWNPLVSLPTTFITMETPGADRDDVSVWELVGLLLVKFRNRFALCVVFQTNVGQILFDIPSNLPPCGDSEGLHTGSLGRHVRSGHVERL